MKDLFSKKVKMITKCLFWIYIIVCAATLWIGPLKKIIITLLLLEIIWLGYMLLLWVQYCKKSKGIQNKPGERSKLFGKAFGMLLLVIVGGIAHFPVTTGIKLQPELKEVWLNAGRILLLLYSLVLMIIFLREDDKVKEHSDDKTSKKEEN